MSQAAIHAHLIALVAAAGDWADAELTGGGLYKLRGKIRSSDDYARILADDRAALARLNTPFAAVRVGDAAEKTAVVNAKSRSTITQGDGQIVRTETMLYEAVWRASCAAVFAERDETRARLVAEKFVEGLSRHETVFYAAAGRPVTVYLDDSQVRVVGVADGARVLCVASAGWRFSGGMYRTDDEPVITEEMLDLSFDSTGEPE